MKWVSQPRTVSRAGEGAGLPDGDLPASWTLGGGAMCCGRGQLAHHFMLAGVQISADRTSGSGRLFCCCFGNIRLC